MKNTRIACSVLLGGLMFMTGCNAPDNSNTAAQKTSPPANTQESARQESSAPPPGMMGLPQYQMRAEVPTGNRLVEGRDGKALFENLCGACHLEFGMGTNLLVRQVIAMDMTPDKALLANREDLEADYVKTVVRNGKMAMPRLTKVDVTDAELDAIANYLAKTNEEANP